MEKKIIDKIKEVEGVEGVFVIRERDCLTSPPGSPLP